MILVMILAMAACGDNTYDVAECHEIPMPAAIEGTYPLWMLEGTTENWGVQMTITGFDNVLVFDENNVLEGTDWVYLTPENIYLVSAGQKHFCIHQDMFVTFAEKVATVYNLDEKSIEMFLKDTEIDISEYGIVFFSIDI